MTRVFAFIDGFNFYHGVCSLKKPRYLWINLRDLANLYLMKNEKLLKVYYYNALAEWDQDKVDRHNIFIDAQKHHGVEVVKGTFNPRWRNFQIKENIIMKIKMREEKKTD